MGVSAAHFAFKDMVKYRKDNNIIVFVRFGSEIEVLIPTRAQVFTKESIRLNRVLGLTGLNYKGNTNNTKK